MSKRVLITGATGGIGQACATLCAELGFSLMLTGRDENKLETLKQSLLKTYPAQSHSIYIDTHLLDIGVTDSQQNELNKALFIKIKKSLGGLDAMLHCAGSLYESSLMTTQLNDIQQQFQQHLTSSILLAQLASRLIMRNASGGSLVFISSVVANQGAAGQSVYACAKSGLSGLTKSLAKELGSQQIRVNMVEPGFIETGLVAHYEQNKKQKIADQTCLKRLGKAQDVANLMLFLISDGSHYITGQSFAVDGGLTIGHN